MAEVPAWLLAAVAVGLAATLALLAFVIVLLLRLRRAADRPALPPAPPAVPALPAPASTTVVSGATDGVLFSERLTLYRRVLDAAERMRAAQASLLPGEGDLPAGPPALRHRAAVDAFSAAQADLEEPLGRLALVAPAALVDLAWQFADADARSDFGDLVARFLAAARTDLGSDRTLGR